MSITVGSLTLYTSEEIADVFRVTPVTLREYIKTGKIKGQKIGGKWYIPEESLKSFFTGTFQASKKRSKIKTK